MRFKSTLCVILSAGLLLEFSSAFAINGLTRSVQRPAHTEAWRKQPPKADAPRPFKLPTVRETRLENGLTLVLIEDHRSPLVTIRVGIPIEIAPGNIDELTNQIALVEATAELITEGAGSRTSEQVAREAETLGGRLTSSANDDYAEVVVSVIAENAERMMDLLGDVLLRPAFPDSEVALHKRNRIQTLVVQRQDPEFLVDEQFARVLFGPHPYGISAPTPSAVDALDRDKIARFYKSNFGPRGSVAVVVGDFNLSRMELKAREVLSGWKESEQKAAQARRSFDIRRPTERRVYLINRPGSEQADFRIGALAVERSSADYFPLLVANAVLGSGTNSRLFLNIRERMGYAYDVYSSVDALRQAGSFFGAAETRTKVTVPAIKSILAEFDRLRLMRVGPRELQNAKNYLNGLFSLALSTQGGIAARVLQSHLLDLGRDYLETYRSRIDAVTSEQVLEAARKYILTDHPSIVVVGDAAKLERTLRAIGQVQVVDIEGKPAKQSAP